MIVLILMILKKEKSGQLKEEEGKGLVSYS